MEIKKYPKSFIPNTVGFKIKAYMEDGSSKIKTVFKDENGYHRIDNFKNVVNFSFFPKEKKIKNELKSGSYLFSFNK